MAEDKAGDLLEKHLREFQKIIGEKEERIKKLAEENAFLRKEIERKMILRPALKERILGDVNRVIGQLRLELKKTKFNEEDLAKKLESLQNKHKSALAEIAAQNKMIGELKNSVERLRKELEKEKIAKNLEVERLKKDHERDLSERLAAQKAEISAALEEKYEKELARQMESAKNQIEELLKVIAEKERE
ncbi:MAG: hypothetical protein J7L54_00825 [Elusimicrobia bacterium]|nr:hypothetical protein [Elusimicrobiota bacterium]